MTFGRLPGFFGPGPVLRNLLRLRFPVTFFKSAYRTDHHRLATLSLLRWVWRGRASSPAQPII